MSGSLHQPIALTTSRSSALLASTWLSLSVSDVSLDEKLKTVTPQSLFLRLCEQLARPDPELEEEDQKDLETIRRRAVFLILRIWARQKWSFDWLHKFVPLKDQAQFFRTYVNLYSKKASEDANALLTDHHLFANLFNLRWEVQVGLKRHFVRKPPGPVVPSGSSGYQKFAGSLPPEWSAENKVYNKYGKKEVFQANIDKLKTMQSDIRCAIHLPSEEQLINDLWEEEEQSKGLKIRLEEMQAQILYELAEVSMLQLKFAEANTYFTKIDELLEKIDEKIFVSFDQKKHEGFRRACSAVLAKRAGKNVDPYADKSAMELAQVILENIPSMNEMARHTIMTKIQNSSGRGRGAHLRSARVANMLCNVLSMGSLPDGKILAESRTSPNYLTKTFQVIQENVLDKPWFNKTHHDRLRELVRILLTGHRKASSLSDLLAHPVAQKFLTESELSRLKSRVETELTPAEPDADFEINSKTEDKNKIREQFNQAVAPRDIHMLVDKLKKLDMLRQMKYIQVRSMNLREIIMMIQVQLRPYAEAFFYKYEQLVALNQHDEALAILEHLQKLFKEKNEPYFSEKTLQVEQTRIIMLKICKERKPAEQIDSGMIKKIQRTVGDIIQFNQSRGEKMKEPGPAWLELCVAILLDESTSCRFDKYKDPLMSFAQKLWNMVNRASKDHRGGMYRTKESHAVWNEICGSLLNNGKDDLEYRRAVRPSIIVTLAKYVYNREIIEILLTFILHLKRMFSDSAVNYALLTPADKLPQNPPKYIVNPVFNLMAINDSVDFLLKTGIEYDKNDPSSDGKFFVIKSEVLLQNGKPKEALGLLLDFQARACYRMTGVQPLSLKDSKYCPIKFNEFIERRCPKTFFKLIGECLERISHYTSAAIAYFYAEEHSKALELVKHPERWDGMVVWYECIWSIDLLEFFCANYHQKGLIKKRDEVKRLIQSPIINHYGSKKQKMNIKNNKTLLFLRKLWRLHSYS